DQRQEFLARLRAIAEEAEHGGSHRRGVLLLHPAHHHAEVARFHYHAHALRFDRLHDGLSDLRRQPLLDLQTTRKYIHEAWQLAQADYFAVRYVSDVDLTEKWQQVMFTQGEHLDVFDDHHLVITDGEQRALQN